MVSSRESLIKDLKRNSSHVVQYPGHLIWQTNLCYNNFMKLLILSGLVGAGKSTVSMLYAKQKLNCARIETDDLRHMVISPHKAPWDGEEGMRQLIIGVKNTCILANQFIQEGFDVIIVDFVTDKTVSIYKEMLANHNPYLVRLYPTYEEAKKRFDSRHETVTSEEFKMLYDIQTKFNKYDLQIDNTLLSPQEVVDQLLKL